MNDDEIVKLYFEADTSSLEKADKTVAVTTQDVYKLADAEKIYEQRQQQSAQATAEREKKLATLRMSTEDYIRTLIKTNEEQDRFSKAMGGAGAAAKKGGADIGYAALQASRGLEDLQYGVGGVVNNIPGLVMALGGGAGLTAAISLLAVGLNQLVKQWPSFINLFRESAPLETSANILHGLNKELETNKKRLEEIESQTSVTKTQQAEYNKILETQANLEKRIADEQKRQADLKKLKALPDEEGKEDKERAQSLQESFGGEAQDQMVAALAESFRQGAEKQLQEAIDKVNSTEGDEQRMWLDRMKQLKKQAEDTPEAFEHNATAARNLLSEAIVGGSRDAFRQIQQQMAGAPGAFSDAQKAAIENNSPEAMAQDRALDAQHEVFLKQQKEKDENRRDYNQRRARELGGEDIENKESDEHAEAYFKQEREKNKAGVQRQIDRENKSIEGGGYIQAATAMMAQIQAQGGMEDQYGRFHTMNKDQIHDFVEQRVLAEMKRRNGRANADVASVITSRASKNLTQQMTALNASGLNNTQKLLSIGMQQQQQYQQLIQQQQRQGLMIDQLARKVRSSGRTHQNSGSGAGAGVQ